MIGTLEEAYAWYRSTRKLTQVMATLGRKHWDALPWEGDLGRDPSLRDLSSAEIRKKSGVVLGDLDDLCVLLLFSVFESIVRERALAEIKAELPAPRHPSLKRLVKELGETIGQGSFFRVLEAFKGQDSNLVEEVNQVRRYRNWVAHGRRGDRPDRVDPDAAFDRLRRFLDAMEANSSPSG